LSVPLSATCTILGLLLSCVLVVWSLLSMFGHWQRALLGFGCLLLGFCLLVVMADIFAVYQHRKQSPNPRSAADAGLAVCLHIGSRWSGAADSGR
jgi:hypothetical protein